MSKAVMALTRVARLQTLYPDINVRAHKEAIDSLVMEVFNSGQVSLLFRSRAERTGAVQGWMLRRGSTGQKQGMHRSGNALDGWQELAQLSLANDHADPSSSSFAALSHRRTRRK